MVRHLATSGLVMVMGLGAIGFVRWRYGEGTRTLRRFAIAFVVCLIVIAGISAGSHVTVAHCPNDPARTCYINDSVPAMAVLAAGYTLAGLIRGWMLYRDR